MRYKIILASHSPRRKELLKGLNLPFETRVLEGIKEDFPRNLSPHEASEYIAIEKAAAYQVGEEELLLTADTTVILNGKVLGKPRDGAQARAMLRAVSGKTHQVVTGVCLTTTREQRHFSVTTDVTFKELSDEEIDYYITHYQPFDKAGAYGIQEWIGYIGVTSIRGSYFNVMGLPVQRIYQELKDMGLINA